MSNAADDLTSLPFDGLLDAAMESLPRPEALRLEAAVMDAVTARRERCVCPAIWEAVVAACQRAPALLAALRAWWSSAAPLVLPLAL